MPKPDNCMPPPPGTLASRIYVAIEREQLRRLGVIACEHGSTSILREKMLMRWDGTKISALEFAQEKARGGSPRALTYIHSLLEIDSDKPLTKEDRKAFKKAIGAGDTLIAAHYAWRLWKDRAPNEKDKKDAYHKAALKNLHMSYFVRLMIYGMLIDHDKYVHLPPFSRSLPSEWMSPREIAYAQAAKDIHQNHKSIHSPLWRYGAFVEDALDMCHVARLREIFERYPALVNACLKTTENDTTPISYAFSKGNPALFQALLKMGADPYASVTNNTSTTTVHQVFYLESRHKKNFVTALLAHDAERLRAFVRESIIPGIRKPSQELQEAISMVLGAPYKKAQAKKRAVKDEKSLKTQLAEVTAERDKLAAELESARMREQRSTQIKTHNPIKQRRDI